MAAPIAQYLGTGKRKTSVARVILRPGDGKTWLNGRPLEDYFPRLAHRAQVLAPLKVAGLEGWPPQGPQGASVLQALAPLARWRESGSAPTASVASSARS